MLKRDLQQEWMDDPSLDARKHELALRGLARLNWISGVAGSMYRHLRRHFTEFEGTPIRLLDIASGSGDVPIAWAKWARRDRLDLQITTLDISEVAIDQQRRRARRAGIDLTTLQRDCLSESLPRGFDFVTCSLFMHHLPDHQVTHLVKQMVNSCSRRVLICDLERSRWNLALVTLAGKVLSRSPIVHHDGPQSVRASFTRNEFHRLAGAGIDSAPQLSSAFPCRFIATLQGAGTFHDRRKSDDLVSAVRNQVSV